MTAAWSLDRLAEALTTNRPKDDPSAAQLQLGG
jgi:hypothetical protein